jgi:hypothetical protein
MMTLTTDIHMLASGAATTATVAPYRRWLEGTRRFGNQPALARRCFR